LDEAQVVARTLGIDVLPLEIRRGEDIAPAFEGLKGKADALYVSLNPLMNAHRIRINTLALGARLPTLVPFRAFVEAGGLMSYGPNQSDVWRRAAGYVDKILHGANETSAACSRCPRCAADLSGSMPGLSENRSSLGSFCHFTRPVSAVSKLRPSSPSMVHVAAVYAKGISIREVSHRRLLLRAPPAATRPRRRSA
jgi:hypothetical protein